MASGDFNNIPQVIEAIQRGIAEGIAKAASVGQGIAANNAAVATGYMRDHVYYMTAKESTYQEGAKSLPEVDKPDSEREALIASAASYSAYVELGTRHMPAQPFMAPMADTLRGELPGILTDAINAAIKGVK